MQSLERSPEFIKAVDIVREQVIYRSKEETFYPRDIKNPCQEDALAFEEVENLLIDQLIKTKLHYDKIGDDEFQRLLECGMKKLDDSDVIEMEACEVEEYEEEEEEEEGEEEEDTPEMALSSFIQELIEEARANSEEEDDEEYIEQRILRGLKTRDIQVQFRP